LVVNLDSLLRMSSNPFFPFMMERIEEDASTTARGIRGQRRRERGL